MQPKHLASLFLLLLSTACAPNPPPITPIPSVTTAPTVRALDLYYYASCSKPHSHSFPNA
jgi:hypothetical protein